MVAVLAALVPIPSAAPWPVQSSSAVEAPTDRRAEILSIADRYATFTWKASEKNVFHGEDPKGARVDTPDVSFHEDGWRPDGTANHGMPYAWGGFTSIEDFEAGLAQGLYAGHVPATERALPSARAMGVDCSGFVARCWDLPIKQSTRSLGALCYELEDPAELLPGDILNKFDSHVVLFKEWVDAARTEMRVIEAGHLRVEENVYRVADHVGRGFQPMRYKPLDARWVPMDFGAPAFTAEEGSGRWIPAGDGGVELGALPNPLRRAVPRSWARYAVLDNRMPGGKLTRSMMAARSADGRVQVQMASEIRGKPLMTGRDLDVTATYVNALLDFAAFEEPLGEMTVVASSVEKGTFELDGLRFPARRISAFLEGSTVMRHKSFALTIELEAIQSDEVPLQGILDATFTMEVVWETDDEGEPTAISRRVLDFALLAFGGSDAASDE